MPSRLNFLSFLHVKLEPAVLYLWAPPNSSFFNNEFALVLRRGCKVLFNLEDTVYLSEPSCARLIPPKGKRRLLPVSVEDLGAAAFYIVVQL